MAWKTIIWPMVVVIGTQDGISHGPEPEGEEYRFKEGELGLLEWKYAPNSDLMEPWVTWDNDNKGLPRATEFCQIVPKGLEQDSCRVIVNFAKTQ